jgi:hypothetical protein
MSDDVRIALWDEENQIWTEEGLSDYQYAASTRMVQFYMAAVGTVALVRERVGEMPYKSWSLKALRNVNEEIDMVSTTGNNEDLFEKQARFTLVTTNHEIIIDIGTSF